MSILTENNMSLGGGYSIRLKDGGTPEVDSHEGAFGIVLKIQDKDGAPFALKIPKLGRDSFEEDMLVAGALEQERSLIKRIRESATDIAASGVDLGVFAQDYNA